MTRRIRLSQATQGWPLFRQTPAGSGIWADCDFHGGEESDYWVVCDDLASPEQAHISPNRVVLVTGEPEAKHYYQPRYLAQFGLVITSQQRIQGSNVLHTQTGLGWHVGVVRPGGGVRRPPGAGTERPIERASMGYDEFRAARFTKTADLSVVCTSKRDVEGQRLRLALVERLKEHFGERLDWFGRGHAPIEDKLDAVAPYRFQVVLENTVERDYWSEKLADAYLGGAFPLYWGCPNLEDYFEPDAYLAIDPRDAQGAIATIERALEEGLTPERIAALDRARDAVLDRYNFFPMLVAALEHCGPAGRPRVVKLRPEHMFRTGPLWRRAARRVRRLVRAA